MGRPPLPLPRAPSSHAAQPGEDGLSGGEGTPFETLKQKAETSTQSRATQTEWATPKQPVGKEKLQLARTRAVLSLSLEDALHADVPATEEALEKLGGLEEEEEEEPSLTGLVEEPIQPTCIKTLSQVASRQESSPQPRRDSPEAQSEARAQASPTPASPSPRAHPLSSLLEGEKTPLCVLPNVPCLFLHVL